MLSLLLIVAVALAHSPLTHVGKLESTEQPEVTTKSEQDQQNVTGTGEDSLPIDLEELTGNNILEQPASTEQEQRATRDPEQTGTSGGEEHQGMTSDPEQSTASVEQERETPGNTELGATSTSERELATSSPALVDTTDILEGERSREESETTEPKATTAARAGQTTRSVRCVPREELRPELQHQYSPAQVGGIFQHIRQRLDDLSGRPTRRRGQGNRGRAADDRTKAAKAEQHAQRAKHGRKTDRKNRKRLARRDRVPTPPPLPYWPY